jgi:hypothetical protein
MASYTFYGKYINYENNFNVHFLGSHGSSMKLAICLDMASCRLADRYKQTLPISQNILCHIS